MGVNNLFIGIPIAALCGFLFLFFSFLNARRAKAVYIFQCIILACLVWTGGSVMMRMQLHPGIHFWFHVSLLGLLLLPIVIYSFLFCIIDINRYSMLGIWGVLTVAGVLMNSIFGIVIESPIPISQDDGSIVYAYTTGPGVYVLILLEIVMLVYVTYLAHQVIGEDLKLRHRLSPLLVGTLAILGGVILVLVTGATFPFDTVGGLVMSVCMAYVMYREYLFEWSYRVKIGVIYMTAMILGFLPVYIITGKVEKIAWLPQGANHDFAMLTVLLMIWGVFVFWVAFKMAERMMEHRRQERFEQIRIFQDETASMFGEEELYDKIVETIENLKIDAELYVFARKESSEAGYEIVREGKKAKGLDEAEMHEIISKVEMSQLSGSSEITLLKYDDKIHGFLYLKMLDGDQMNYIEEECYHQIGAYASVCLKNASVYQEVYQLSIHDELTGLYNRAYYKEFVKQYWKPDKTQALIYMDVDDFKLFNELYGEECGDEILRWCGIKMREVIGKEGATFRLASNEFVIFTRCVDKDKLRILALQIQKKIEAPDDAKPKVIQPITLSIGIASYPEAASTAEEQLQQAKKALFFAKKNGKNRVEIYETAVAEQELNERGDKSYEQIAPTIYALTAAIDAKDSYTFEHSCHVSADAVLLATAIGLNNNEIRTVKEAGLLHDIGKIGVPESILKKQGKLTQEEYEIMKTHVTNSIEMIHHLPNMDYVIPAVLAHHERYDGKGYPRGLEGEGIPLLGRILAVCDSYDAITSKRSYKEALSKEYAIAELERNKGTQFDPVLADAFVKLIREGKIERQNLIA